jgi:hypothetical protein
MTKLLHISSHDRRAPVDRAAEAMAANHAALTAFPSTDAGRIEACMFALADECERAVKADPEWQALKAGRH